MSNKRTELQNQVVEALVHSKAVNFEAVGQVLAKFGDRAALTGDAIGVIIHRRVMDVCIPPFSVDNTQILEAGRPAASVGEQE